MGTEGRVNSSGRYVGLSLSGLGLAHFKLLLATSPLPNYLCFSRATLSCAPVSVTLYPECCFAQSLSPNHHPVLPVWLRTSFSDSGPSIPSLFSAHCASPVRTGMVCAALVCRSAVKRNSTTGDRDLISASLFP